MHANQQFYLRSSKAICNIWSSVGSSSSNCPNHHLRLRRHCVIKKSSASEEALKLWKTKDGRNLTLQTSNLWTHYELDFKSDRVWWGGVGSFPRSSPDPFLETKCMMNCEWFTDTWYIYQNPWLSYMIPTPFRSTRLHFKTSRPRHEIAWADAEEQPWLRRCGDGAEEVEGGFPWPKKGGEVGDQAILANNSLLDKESCLNLTIWQLYIYVR